MTAALKTVCIDKTFHAPVAELFQAWIVPERVKRWLSPGVMQVTQVAIEPVEGGCYRLSQRDPGGEQLEVIATIKRLEMDRCLELEWRWQGITQLGILRIELNPRDESVTELRLTHGEFASMDETQNHENGWTVCLEKLAKVLGG